MQQPIPHPGADVPHADIATVYQNFLEGQHAIGVGIADTAASEIPDPGPTIDSFVQGNESSSQCCGHDDRFEATARLDGVGDATVSPVIYWVFVAEIGIKGGVAGHGQYVAGLRR